MKIIDATEAVLELSPVLDLVAASALQEAFTQHRGHSIRLDASGVQRLGGQCLQVLLAARAAWAVDGKNFLIEHESEEFSTSLELLGMPIADLTYAKDAT